MHPCFLQSRIPIAPNSWHAPVLVYKPLIHVCIHHLEYRLNKLAMTKQLCPQLGIDCTRFAHDLHEPAYPSHSTSSLLSDCKPESQLLKTERPSFTPLHSPQWRLRLDLNPKSKIWFYSKYFQTELVGRHSTWAEATVRTPMNPKNIRSSPEPWEHRPQCF